jgi:hypothetical protein
MDRLVDEHHSDSLLETMGGLERIQPRISAEFTTHPEVAAKVALQRGLDPVQLHRVGIYDQEHRPGPG